MADDPVGHTDPDGTHNLRWSHALIGALGGAGVGHAVISPGSRSSPLTLACARTPGLQTWVIPDERSAAFFALGLSRATGAPAMVVATSGSAPANWFPAVVEAHMDFRPLLLLSADRPAELQGCGANQTIDQTRLFGTRVRGYFALPEPDPSGALERMVISVARQAADRSAWPVPGPVHINAPFREPLVPVHGSVEVPSVPPGQMRAWQGLRVPLPGCVGRLRALVSGERGLIVCGRGSFAEGFAQAVTALAARLDCPILADPLSGLRFGSHDRSRVLACHDAFLRAPSFVAAHRPRWVLQFGGTPVSRSLTQYLGSVADAHRVLVAPWDVWQDPGRSADEVVHADPVALCEALSGAGLQPADSGWMTRFRQQDEAVGTTVLAGDGLPLEAMVLREAFRLLPAGSAVFCANSTVIRDVDSFATGSDTPIRLMGNRGASGIDGNVSTVLGMAAAGRSRPVVGLLGDLALYHDMNGLIAAREVDATLVVFNNGGGAIFRHMPQAGLPEFERYWLTPTHLDIGRIAALYGLGHRRVGDPAGFAQAFGESLQAPGTRIIEVEVDAAESVRLHQAFHAAVCG